MIDVPRHRVEESNHKLQAQSTISLLRAVQRIHIDVQSSMEGDTKMR